MSHGPLTRAASHRNHTTKHDGLLRNPNANQASARVSGLCGNPALLGDLPDFDVSAREVIAEGRAEGDRVVA